MPRRYLYGLGAVLLLVSATLLIWQGSFTFGNYAPTSPEQTFVYWAVSILVFLLTVTLGFMLIRTCLRLYVDRRSGREGSRIRTKLVLGALALSIIPVCFLVLWSVSVLNYNLAKWFSRPTEGVRDSLADVLKSLDREARESAAIQAGALAGLPEVQNLASDPKAPAGVPARVCAERGVAAAVVVRLSDRARLSLCGSAADLKRIGQETAVRAPILLAGQIMGYVVVPPKPRLDLTAKQKQIEAYVREYDRLTIDRKGFRNLYLLLLALISLFVLFLATWIALFLSKQISNPITALLEAAGEVRKGNLGYRVETKAIDELATLVRAFNEMTQALDANSRELEQRRRFTEAILESIPTGVISISGDGRILRVNRAMRRLLSEERIEAASRLEDLFTREETADIKYLMKRARRTGVVSRQLELRNGARTLRLSATIAALEEKLTSGFVIVLEDMSDVLRMEKMAAWHEVARRIAHEIKNPLTPIALCSERIARQIDRLSLPPEPERILRECAVTIANEVESVKTLVNEFSQFARFPAAQPSPCDLNEIVETALGVFAGRLDGIEIHKALAPGLPPVGVDREQFKRVIVNLVDNAAESMQETLIKHLYVATQAAGDVVELVVADTGCGVSPDVKDRLFLPYFSTKGRGTGLGLAIVSHILAEHGATIRVEDNRPQGARFIIEIAAGTAADPESPVQDPKGAAV